jgi:hypothetical protein
VRVHSPTSRSGSRIYLSIWDLFWALVSPILALHLRDVDLNALSFDFMAVTLWTNHRSLNGPLVDSDRKY